ncbi:Plasma membrane low glucose sensor [Parelaphostrongylus tenuis]|uniref:Plasma membrane low glucose sensor n=1 Tax=Parelaphostrongylus tenuis TaxID=148309 RepID=A0AAD5LUG4_PARTN|nr:Plasma membrane low glucose sensor [Parelaphostrongylus tenuis]
MENFIQPRQIKPPTYCIVSSDTCVHCAFRTTTVVLAIIEVDYSDDVISLFRDGLVMCIINGSTSILAGFVVFSILGYMSFIAQKDIAEIVKPGVGLAFLAYPEVASNLPAKQLWSCLFFLMITILGLDSQVCMMEGLFTALEDSFPFILRKHKKFP